MRNITANLHTEKGRLNRYFFKCVGAGRAAEVMRHSAYEQLRFLQAECPFEYIRFHGLFHDEMGIVHRKDNGELCFNFQYVDLLFDSLLALNIRPLVELGLMPEALASGEDTVFWWKMNKTMPKELGEWSALVEALVRHLTDRYGEEEVKAWYFEVWNEPDLESFFRSDDRMNEYFALYEAAARAVKRVCPEYRVGGPTTSSLTWIAELIAHCRENEIPLDFISGHRYSTDTAYKKFGRKDMTLLMPPEKLIDRVVERARECRKEGYPLLVTEWSTSWWPLDPVHDCYISAPFVLHVLKRCEGSADLMSYWTYTDIFEEEGVPKMPFHGGFGLLNIQGLPKPTYYAYKMLAGLGNTELVCEDPDAYVCRTDSEVQVLFWNSVYLAQDAPNQEFFIRPLVPKKLDDATVSLSGLESGRTYSVSVETIGYRSGDVYDAYLEQKFKDLPTREQTAELIEASRPRKVAYIATADADGTLTLSVEQTENQVDLIRISLL